MREEYDAYDMEEARLERAEELQNEITVEALIDALGK